MSSQEPIHIGKLSEDGKRIVLAIREEKVKDELLGQLNIKTKKIKELSNEVDIKKTSKPT